MPARKDSEATPEVIPVVPVFHGPPEFPEFAQPGERVVLKLDPDPEVNARKVRELVEAGHVLLPPSAA